jgi:glucose-fructose oxidoreductase
MNRPTSPSPLLSRRRFVGQLSAAAAATLVARRALALDALAGGKRLRIALCGLGSYATDRLLPAIKQSKLWTLTGVVTGDRDKGLRWAREEGFSEKNVFGYETMGQMADRSDIDAVYVVTPNALHAENTIAAAKAGKHVICEKPMAVSVAQCDAMMAACKKAGVRLMIGYRLHYEPHTAEFARLGREKVFGPFMKIKSDNGFDMGPTGDPHAWRVVKSLAGGGPLMDMGVYVIQAVCMAKGEEAPAAVTAEFGEVTRPALFAQVEQSIRWTMEYADGAVGRCFASYADQVSTIRAEAAHGWAEIEYPAFYYDDPILVTSQGKPDFPSSNHQLLQMEGMAGEILQSRPSLAPGEMGRRDVAVIEAIYAAARSGKRTEVRV